MAVHRVVGSGSEREGPNYRGWTWARDADGRCVEGTSELNKMWKLESGTKTDGRQTISMFKAFARSIDAVYMIEASPQLRKQQAKLLSGSEEMKETELGWKSPCRYLPGSDVIWCEDIRFVPKGQHSCHSSD
jgi:hypothetical protein